MTESWEYGEAAAPGGGDARAFPWPPSEGEPVLAAFGETWRSVTFDPSRVFARLPRDGGTGAAVLYYLVIGILVSGAGLFWDTMGRLTGAAAGDSLARELGLDAMQPITGFLLSPLALLLGLFIAAGVVHLLLLIFDGAHHGFGTTLRTFCYCYSPMIFGVIPILGTIVGSIWMVVIAIRGLREAHGAEGWKPALAVILPFLLGAALAVYAVITLLAAGAALMA